MFPDGKKNNNDQVEKIYVFLDNNTKSWKTWGLHLLTPSAPNFPLADRHNKKQKYFI